jgi:hypothetical protein
LKLRNFFSRPRVWAMSETHAKVNRDKRLDRISSNFCGPGWRIAAAAIRKAG